MPYGWPAYVPVAKRRAKAKRAMDKLRKKGKVIQPIEIEGRKITRTFWGDAWCQHLEQFSDYDNRLPRGKTYVRNGSVCHLGIEQGKINAIVSGSSLYDIAITIKPLPKTRWEAIKKSCAGKIGSLLELLKGRLSDSVMAVVTDPKKGLFPGITDIQLQCSCLDWADMCKHLAAVLYGVGARLDQQPELLFTLRGVDHETLISTDINIPTATGGRRRLVSDASNVFGIDLDNTTRSSDQASVPKRRAAATRQNDPSASTRQSNIKKRRVQPFEATGASISQLRHQWDMTRAQFARLLHVAPPTVTQWESKKGALNLHEKSRQGLTKVAHLSKKQAWKKLKANQ
jgi:uncharacterized Zn finger protein